MFEGIEDEILGDFGILQGGAAGLEIDCVDPALGTPPHALVVARSENHSNTYELVAEEVRIPHGATDAILNGAHPRRHRVLRDAGRRRRVLDRLDRLCRQPVLERLRQQHRAADQQRAAPICRSYTVWFRQLRTSATF